MDGHDDMHHRLVKSFNDELRWNFNDRLWDSLSDRLWSRIIFGTKGALDDAIGRSFNVIRDGLKETFPGSMS